MRDSDLDRVGAGGVAERRRRPNRRKRLGQTI